MVDGVVLLVDASARARCRRPASCCARRSRRSCRSSSCINKVDRPDSRIAEVVDETYELFLDLRRPPRSQIDFPIVYASAKAGRASLSAPTTAACPTATTSRPLFDDHPRDHPRAVYDDEAPLQAHVTNLDASTSSAASRCCRVFNGTMKKGQQVDVVPRTTAPAAGQDHRAADDRGARAQARRQRRPRRHHRASPASPRSPSARPSPTRTTPSRCRSSRSTSPPSR